jgi:NAD+ kinase
VSPLRRIGLVTHPTRDVGAPVDTVRRWAADHGVDLVNLVDASRGEADVPDGVAEDCDLVIAIGGDGTVLGGVRAAAPHGIPILGIACGSLGMLTGASAEAAHEALDRFSRGDWQRRPLAALHLRDNEGGSASALNDVAVVRKGAGQVKAAVSVDGELYVRVAGDGLVVSTPVGSTAYGMAAGGPIVVPGTEAVSITPLNPHGGSAPPLVVPAHSTIELEVHVGFSGMRVEVDGQSTTIAGTLLELRLRPDHAVLVGFGENRFLTGLRRRRLVEDSPRIVAHDDRMARDA